MLTAKSEVVLLALAEHWSIPRSQMAVAYGDWCDRDCFRWPEHELSGGIRIMSINCGSCVVSSAKKED